MKRLFTLVILLILSACASGHRSPFDDRTPAVRDLKGLYDALDASISRSEQLSTTDIGKVAYGPFVAPIRLIAYRPAQRAQNKPRILIDAGVHGNEPAGVDYVVRLIAGLAAGKTPFQACEVDIIPVVNPWGWSHHRRFNKEGIDINRDFSSRRSQEANIIIAFLKDKKYDLVLDLHEDPNAKGIYYYQYARKDKVMLNKLVARMGEAGYPIETNVNMILLKTKNGIIDAPLWGLWYVKLTGQLSLSNYSRLNVSDDVFTLETPTHLPLDKRVAAHEASVRFLIESLFPGHVEPDLENKAKVAR
jgi:hypothetical protein